MIIIMQSVSKRATPLCARGAVQNKNRNRKGKSHHVCSKVKVRFQMIFKSGKGWGLPNASWQRVPELGSGPSEAPVAPRRA